MASHIEVMNKTMIVRPKRRPSPILICRKCLKRSDDGKDIKRGLKAALKTRAEPDMKPARLVSTSCFGLCPKRAVVVASGASLQRNEFALLASCDDVVDTLDRL